MNASTMMKANDPARGSTPAPAIRFTRASIEHAEPAFDVSVTAAEFAAGPKQLPSLTVPAYGYAREIVLLVEATSGAAGLNNAVAKADAPWSVIKSITFKDISGGFIFGPMSGYNLFLANKWGGYGFLDNPVSSAAYSAIAASGNFAFILRIPLEAIARDALGALPNLNSANTYQVDIVIADDSDVYSTAPDTKPGLRVRGWLEAWSKPSATDAAGRAQKTSPPAEKTTQFWTVSQHAVSGSGAKTIKVPRVGNFIRNIGLVFRDSGDAREGDSGFSNPVSLTIDGQVLVNELPLIRRDKMVKRYGYTLASISTADFDEAVLWYDFTHDFDGKPGGELRDLWLPTMPSSRLEFELTAGEAGTYEVIINDVAVGAPIE